MPLLQRRAVLVPMTMTVFVTMTVLMSVTMATGVVLVPVRLVVAVLDGLVGVLVHAMAVSNSVTTTINDTNGDGGSNERLHSGHA